MLRLLIFILGIVTTVSMNCTELQTIYSRRECCNQNNADTCLRALPACTDTSVVAGQICTDANGRAFVKGLAEAFNLSDTNKIILKKHIIPDTNAQYDLGSAEYKFRHQYLSDT